METKKKIFYADKIFWEEKEYGPGYLTIMNNKFYSYNEEQPMNGGRIHDYTGYWIAPGLVYTHIHGYKGYEVMTPSFEGLNNMSENLLSCGVTSFLPTTLTASVDSIDRVVELTGRRAGDVRGAKIQGIFLEGPFLNEKYKGAQNDSYILDPSVDLLKHWQNLSDGMIKKVALAPERDGAKEFITYAKQEGIVIGLGHSNATYSEAKQAVNHGAKIFIHTFNAMRGLHHREPGIAGAAMNVSDVYAELICDGHHIHPVMAKLLMNARGRDEIVLITDCISGGGLPEGNYFLGEFLVEVKEEEVTMENGQLAGSVLELHQAMKNCVEWGIASPEEAIRMASTVPAKSLGIEKKCGIISEGIDADFIVISPELDLQATYLNGQKRYSK